MYPTRSKVRSVRSVSFCISSILQGMLLERRPQTIGTLQATLEQGQTYHMEPIDTRKAVWNGHWKVQLRCLWKVQKPVLHRASTVPKVA